MGTLRMEKINTDYKKRIEKNVGSAFQHVQAVT